jgi:hypothetical protein
MNTSFLDMLQNAADINILAITKKVDIQLNGVFDEFIDEDWIFRAVFWTTYTKWKELNLIIAHVFALKNGLERLQDTFYSTHIPPKSVSHSQSGYSGCTSLHWNSQYIKAPRGSHQKIWKVPPHFKHSCSIVSQS